MVALVNHQQMSEFGQGKGAAPGRKEGRRPRANFRKRLAETEAASIKLHDVS
jgi:hypothetical protein